MIADANDVETFFLASPRRQEINVVSLVRLLKIFLSPKISYEADSSYRVLSRELFSVILSSSWIRSSDEFLRSWDFLLGIFAACPDARMC